MKEDSSVRTITPSVKTFFGLLLLAAVLLGVGLAAAPLGAEDRARAQDLVERARTELAAGDRGAAVLDLERARRLAPRARFVRSAIESAGIEHPEPPVERTLRLLTSREWTGLATALGWFAGLAAALAILRRSSRTAWKVALTSTTAFFAAMLGVAHTSLTAAAVVTAAGTRALVAPYAGAAPAGPLPAGTVVVRGSEHGDFVRVRSGDGVEGWMPAASLAPITRRAS